MLKRSPETQKLLVPARWLMRLTLKPSFEFPGSVTPGPAAKTGSRSLLLGIIHGDRTYRIKRVSSDSPCVACYPRLGRKYIIHSGHSLGYLLAEAAPTDIAFKTG